MARWFDSYDNVCTCENCKYADKSSHNNHCETCLLIYCTGGKQYTQWEEIPETRERVDWSEKIESFVDDLKIYVMEWLRYFEKKYLA